MNSAVVCFLGACALTSCLVTSSPVYPKFDMKHYHPTDVCLYICNICYDGMTSDMLNCANNICLANDQSAFVIGMFKLGETCKKFNPAALNLAQESE